MHLCNKGFQWKSHLIHASSFFLSFFLRPVSYTGSPSSSFYFSFSLCYSFHIFFRYLYLEPIQLYSISVYRTHELHFQMIVFIWIYTFFILFYLEKHLDEYFLIYNILFYRSTSAYTSIILWQIKSLQILLRNYYLSIDIRLYVNNIIFSHLSLICVDGKKRVVLNEKSTAKLWSSHEGSQIL